MHRALRCAAAALLALASASIGAEPPAPAEIADAFAAALKKGDRAGALKLLAPELVVYESGGVESSREEYESHHLGADIEFLKGIKAKRLGRTHAIGGDIAWVATRSRLTGTYKDKPIDLFSNETLSMKRAKGSWVITHIHWSSRPAKDSSH